MSRNCCAFPNCNVAIAEGTSLVGEICHISAANAAGPRFDGQQTEEQRQSYDNLILLCANHHKVIDDDVVAYSVTRLLAMKATHESGDRPLPDTPEIATIAQNLIGQSADAAQHVSRLAAEIERAYVSGGGPLNKDFSKLCLTVNNYGKTPAVMQEYAVGFCPLEEIPIEPTYRRVSYREQIAPGTQARVIAAIDIPPLPRPMLAYGRHWFLDIWMREHSAGFVLVIEATGTHGHVPPVIPRAYTDWD
jgi:hypothetical protein